MSHIVIHSPQFKVGKVDYTTFESSKLDTSRRKFSIGTLKEAILICIFQDLSKIDLTKEFFHFFNSYVTIIKPLPIVAFVNMS
jgi:hypothetical protein